MFLNVLKCSELAAGTAWCASGLSWRHQALLGALLAAPRIAWRASGFPGAQEYSTQTSAHKENKQVCSTRFPNGNQVNGLPLVAHTHAVVFGAALVEHLVINDGLS